MPPLLAATDIDVNQADAIAGYTPLIAASSYRATAAALALLADPRTAVDARANDGKAAISHAVATDNAQLAAALIARGADVSPAFPNPLLAACAVGDAREARELLLQTQQADGADALPPLARACLVGTPAQVAALDLSAACDADGHVPPPLALAVEVSGARGDEGGAVVRALVDGMGGVDNQQQRDALLAAAASAAATPASAPAGSAYAAFVLALVDAGLLDAPGLACKAAKALVLAYLGSIAASAHMAAVEGAFDALKKACVERLEHIAAPLEEVCTTQDLCALLGSVGAAVGSPPVALDHPRLLPMPKYIWGCPRDTDRDYEPYLIEYIHMASLALDDPFVDRVVEALKPFGDGVVKVDDGKGTIRITKGGQPLIDITRAPVKSHGRMNNKLESAEDHMHKPLPRPMWNIDTIRLGVVVYDPRLIAAVYAAIDGKVGSAIRVKNAFAVGAEVNYGYRAILCNLRFESGVTVREVFGGAQRAKWVALGEARRAIDGAAGVKVEVVLEALLANTEEPVTRGFQNQANASMPDAPLNIAAEVQLIYEPYLSKGRKLSHLPYKVVRCASAAELARDAGGKKQSAEVRAAVRAAERECMGFVKPEVVMKRADEARQYV